MLKPIPIEHERVSYLGVPLENDNIAIIRDARFDGRMFISFVNSIGSVRGVKSRWYLFADKMG